MRCIRELIWAVRVLRQKPRPMIMDKWYEETRGRGDKTVYLIKCNRCGRTKEVCRNDALWCGENCRQRASRDRKRAKEIVDAFSKILRWLLLKTNENPDR